jgi:hypothetical protein
MKACIETYLFTCVCLYLQVVLESDRLAREYDSVLIERGVPIKQDMLLDRTGGYLYAMTDKKVRSDYCRQLFECGLYQHTASSM